MFKQLSVRHLKEHNLDARSYRAKYGIPRAQPLSAKDTTAMRKKIVQQSRPWEKAPTYMKAHAPKTPITTPAKASRSRKKVSESA
jgi:predicted transcriptional regulator